MLDRAKEDAVRISSMSCRWPGASQDALRVSNLRVAPGESLLLRGPSGSGKSTLLSAVAGVIDVPKGSVLVNGTDIGALRGAERDRFRVDHVGVIFQVFNLLPWLSALDNVLLPCRFSKRRHERAGPDQHQSAIRLLGELGLSDRRTLTAPAMSLSVGQQQRVAAARALIGTPELILADEPTSALDEDRKAVFVDLLRREAASVGAALLFVSHDRGFEGHFDRVVEFSDLNGGPATC